MADFRPDIGWVICHAYLWWNEARRGREEGAKDRPCVITHTRLNEYEETEVYISPITHTPPEVPEKAIAIPLATKARLGLDSEDSWIITTEVNRFIWPGRQRSVMSREVQAYLDAVANQWRARARKFMEESEHAPRSANLIRLTAMASTLEWAASDLSWIVRSPQLAALVAASNSRCQAADTGATSTSV